jgi:hypothetical protein
VLEPGRQVSFAVEAVRIPFGIDPDTQLRPYVLDVEGTRWRGVPQPLYGLLLGHGWQPNPHPGKPDPISSMLIDYESPPELKGLLGRLDLTQGDPVGLAVR